MNTFKRWLPAIVIMLILFYLSSRGHNGLAPTYFWNVLANKGAHLFWYFLLCMAFFRGTKDIVSAILLTVLYGITDETHQQFVPGRTGQLNDVFIDFAGAGFAGLILWKFYQHLPKKLRNWLKA